MYEIPFLTPKELRKQFPASRENLRFIDNSRLAIHNILSMKDSRHLLIVGPCSIHDIEGAKEYANRLKELSQQVRDIFYIVMRTYIEKPRSALGWRGFIHDPYLDGSHQIDQGYILSREFLLYLAELKLPSACEFLDATTSTFNGDLISWGCIGARTSNSQVHRQLASDLPMPVGFKNSIEGNIESAVNGCLTASYPHTFLGLNMEGILSIQRSKGNPDVHLILRGGETGPNYDKESIQLALQMLRRSSLPERVLIDCSHGNCQKKHELQKEVFRNVMIQSIESTAIRGIMLESYLYAGNQPLNGPLNDLRYGVSITDPCLSWEETEQLVMDGYAIMQRHAETTF